MVAFLPVADPSRHVALDDGANPAAAFVVSPGAPPNALHFGCGHRNICCFFLVMHFGGDLAVSCRNLAFWPSASATVGSAQWLQHQNRRDISNGSAAARDLSQFF